MISRTKTSEPAEQGHSTARPRHEIRTNKKPGLKIRTPGTIFEGEKASCSISANLAESISPNPFVEFEPNAPILGVFVQNNFANFEERIFRLRPDFRQIILDRAFSFKGYETQEKYSPHHIYISGPLPGSWFGWLQSRWGSCRPRCAL